ncbi:MAG: SUMF1/EgtB/PvdO family nonheme iron enzyme [Deltaproteobacteria bacterium]|nr:SUMF1/EgtB/PvdO family nonheme iron enzyme [Deltaproteobacteria bacterium]
MDRLTVTALRWTRPLAAVIAVLAASAIVFAPAYSIAASKAGDSKNPPPAQDAGAPGPGKDAGTGKEEKKKAAEPAKGELVKLDWLKGPVKDKSELPSFKMIYVKGKCFDMGDWTGDGDDDERPVHKVCLSNYYIGETEVTQKLFAAVLGFIPNEAKFLGPDNPVGSVTAPMARGFIKRLNELTKGYYRLPTEAEWEFAARGGGKTERWAGVDNEDTLADYAWFSENSDGTLHPVKQKKPNGYGIYDMTGNVWELTEDYFDFDYYQRSSQRDPLNMEYTTWNSMRGGSIADEPFWMRATYRYGIEMHKASASANVGFRLAE